MEINLNALVTEQRNPRTEHIDEVPTEELCRLINQEDQTVPIAVEKELPQIAKAIDVIAAQIEVGGRLFYCGAGTSGPVSYTHRQKKVRFPEPEVSCKLIGCLPEVRPPFMQ